MRPASVISLIRPLSCSTTHPLPSSSRNFASSRRIAALSESDHNVDEAHRKKIIDDHKGDSLDKQKQGQGQWKHDLASNSERNIAADKHDVKDHEEHISELQKETSKTYQQEHEHGKR